MRVIYTVILILFVAAIAVFCVQNMETVSVAYLDWSASLPLPLLTLIIYVLGMLSGGTLLSLLRRSLRRATQSDE